MLLPFTYVYMGQYSPRVGDDGTIRHSSAADSVFQQKGKRLTGDVMTIYTPFFL